MIIMKSIKPYILLIVSMLIVSCGNSKLKGYEWLEGVWESDEYFYMSVNITQEYMQSINGLLDGEGNKNIYSAPKDGYSIEIVHNYFLGDIKAINQEQGTQFYIDEAKKSIYYIYDFDQKVYLTKID